jgi:hypothetical protein
LYFVFVVEERNEKERRSNILLQRRTNENVEKFVWLFFNITKWMLMETSNDYVVNAQTRLAVLQHSWPIISTDSTFLFMFRLHINRSPLTFKFKCFFLCRTCGKCGATFVAVNPEKAPKGKPQAKKKPGQKG